MLNISILFLTTALNPLCAINFNRYSSISINKLTVMNSLSTFLYSSLESKRILNVEIKNSKFLRFLDTAIRVQNYVLINRTFSVTQYLRTDVNGQISVDSCFFDECRSKDVGGAVLFDQQSAFPKHKIEFKNCVFHKCYAINSGAIFVRCQIVTMFSCCFNTCLGSISNQAFAFQSTDYGTDSRIDTTSVFKCPNNGLGRYSTTIQDFALTIKNFNSTNNEIKDNAAVIYIHSCYETELTNINFANNSGINGIAVDGTEKIVMIFGNFYGNNFKVSPISGLTSFHTVMDIIKVYFVKNAKPTIPNDDFVFFYISYSCFDNDLVNIFGINQFAIYISNCDVLYDLTTLPLPEQQISEICYYFTYDSTYSSQSPISSLYIWIIIGAVILMLIVASVVLMLYNYQKKKNVEGWIRTNEQQQENS